MIGKRKSEAVIERHVRRARFITLGEDGRIRYEDFVRPDPGILAMKRRMTPKEQEGYDRAHGIRRKG
jgi:hypothetical protein